MRRRLLDLCLLTYPGNARRDDGEYLRDLATELAEDQGIVRQAASLLLGGIRERAAARRWGWQVVAVALVSLGVASGGVAVAATANGERQLDRFACTSTAGRTASRCAASARVLVAAHEQAGWHCSSDGRPVDASRVRLQCTRSR